VNEEQTNRNEQNLERIMTQLAALAEQQRAHEQEYLARCGNVVTTSGAQLPDDPEHPFRQFVLARAFEAAGDDMSRGRGHATLAVSGHRWVNGQWLDYAGPETGVWLPDEEGLLAEQRVEATVELMEQGLTLGIEDLRAELEQLEAQRDVERDEQEAERLGERMNVLKAKIAALARARAALRSRRTRETIQRDARKHLRLAGDACDAEDAQLNTPAGLLDLRTPALGRAGREADARPGREAGP
jgi:hypothetical protein